jgi:hypothetical protein
VGAAGISFVESQRCAVSRSYVHDTSGAAVQFAKFNGDGAALAPAPNAAAASRDVGHVLSECVIEATGNELRGAAAVSVGYASGVIVANNTIVNTPASAVSIGWGWGR